MGPSSHSVSLSEIPLPKSHNWLIHKILLESISEAASKYARGNLVDIGCGRKPWEKVFSPYVTEYVGVDHEDTFHDIQKADVIADAYQTTLDDECADTVLLINVLEHLEEPIIAAKEICRVLRKDGHAIVIAPMFWHVHEAPRDFYRFTPFGFQYVFESVGLQVVELKPLCGFYVTFLQEFCYVLNEYSGNPFLKLFVYVIVNFLQMMGWCVRWFDRAFIFSVGHVVVVRKPADLEDDCAAFTM